MQRRAIATAGTLAIVGGAVWSLTLLDDWVGDWGALLWLCGTFLLPFLAGLAWGAGGGGRVGRVAGALVGAALVLLPSLAVDAARDAAAPNLGLLWAVYGPLAAAQGAITLPVGANGRSRASNSNTGRATA